MTYFRSRDIILPIPNLDYSHSRMLFHKSHYHDTVWRFLFDLLTIIGILKQNL